MSQSPERKPVASATLVACAAALAWGFWRSPSSARAEDEPPAAAPASAGAARGYPELDAADPELVRRIGAAWGEGEGSDRLSSFGRSGKHDDDPTASRVLAVVDPAPDRGSMALLAFLFRRFGKPDGAGMSGGPSADAEQWAACWLRAHASPAASAVMRRLVADGAVDGDLRQEVAIALCRRDDSASLAALLDVVTDDRQPLDFRRYVLARMPRLGGAASRRLRELLLVPFSRLAAAAAAALAEWGDPQAPSLLAFEYRRSVVADDGLGRCASAQALLQSVGDDPELAPRLRDAAEQRRTYTHAGGPDGYAKAVAEERAGFLRVADAVDAWLDANPAVRDTEFEQARAAYLAGPRRAREASLRTFDDVLAAKDEDLDVAAALLVPDADGLARGRLLELDCLARLVRRDVGPTPTPAQWIEAMNRRLLPNPYVRAVGGDESDLGRVIDVASGDCMGRSTVYFAVADRLGLPVFAVQAPNHVFLRWDDGKLRRNIETTSGGAELSDSQYASREGGLAIREEDAKSGAFLANLSRRRFLALAFANRANARLERGDAEGAWKAADQAVRLAPEDANARICRARQTLVVRPSDVAAAVEDIKAAQGGRRLSVGEACVAANVSLDAGLADDALRLADAAHELDPKVVDVWAVRIRALLRLRRVDEARRALGEVWEHGYEVESLRLADVEALWATSDPSWRERLAAAVDEPLDEPTVHLVVAKSMLDGIGDRSPSATDAARALDVVRDLALEKFERPTKRFGGTKRGTTNPVHRRSYLELRLRCCRALKDDAGAAAAEAELAKLDAKK